MGRGGESEIERMVVLNEKANESEVHPHLTPKRAYHTRDELDFMASFDQDSFEKKGTLLGCALNVQYTIKDIAEVTDMNVVIVKKAPCSVVRPEGYRLLGENDLLGKIITELEPGKKGKEFVNGEGEKCELKLIRVEADPNTTKGFFRIL